MSAYPSLPLFTDAFIADTGHLSAQETGAYLMLMMVAWRSPDCRLADDDDRLARWARLDRRTWLRIKSTVLEFWTLSDGFWTQKRLSKEREIVSKRAEAARENGKQGGRPKSLKDNETANPLGSAQVSEQKAPNPNPIQHSEVKPLRVGAAKRGKLKTRIESDTQPDDRQRSDARDRGIHGDELRREWCRFRDHHLKNGSLFSDWQAAWRSWLDHPIRQRERQQSQQTNSQSNHAALNRLATLVEERRDPDRNSSRFADFGTIIDHAGDRSHDRGLFEPLGRDAGQSSAPPDLRLVGSRWR